MEITKQEFKTKSLKVTKEIVDLTEKKRLIELNLQAAMKRAI